MSTTAYLQQIYAAEQQNGIPHGLLAGLIQRESGGNPGAVNFNTNGSVDQGIAQINSQAQPQVSAAQAYSPSFAIPWAASKLAALHQTYGSWSGALQAYNSGSPTGAPTYASDVTSAAAAFGYQGSGTSAPAGSVPSVPSVGSTPTAPSLGQVRGVLVALGIGILVIALLRIL